MLTRPAWQTGLITFFTSFFLFGGEIWFLADSNKAGVIPAALLLGFLLGSIAYSTCKASQKQIIENAKYVPCTCCGGAGRVLKKSPE